VQQSGVRSVWLSHALTDTASLLWGGGVALQPDWRDWAAPETSDSGEVCAPIRARADTE